MNDESGDCESPCGKETCSNSILKQWKDQEKRPDNIIAADDIHSTKLEKILHTSNLPLYLFDSIMSWASASTICNDNFPHTPQSQKRFFKSIYTNYDFHGIAPVLKILQLPSSRCVVDVVSYDKGTTIIIHT